MKNGGWIMTTPPFPIPTTSSLSSLLHPLNSSSSHRPLRRSATYGPEPFLRALGRQESTPEVPPTLLERISGPEGQENTPSPQSSLSGFEGAVSRYTPHHSPMPTPTPSEVEADLARFPPSPPKSATLQAEITESTHPPRSQLDATVALCKAIFYYKRDHPDNEQMNAWTDDIMVPILAMKETNSTLPLPITNAEYNRIVHLTYISAFTDKIEEYIDLAMQDVRPPSLLERITTPTHASAPPTDVSVSNSDEEDPNHPGEDWIKFDINDTKHYPLIFINEDGKEELAQYIRYLSLGDGITLQGTKDKVHCNLWGPSSRQSLPSCQFQW